MSSYDAQYLCDEWLHESAQATVLNNETKNEWCINISIEREWNIIQLPRECSCFLWWRKSWDGPSSVQLENRVNGLESLYLLAVSPSVPGEVAIQNLSRLIRVSSYENMFTTFFSLTYNLALSPAVLNRPWLEGGGGGIWRICWFTLAIEAPGSFDASNWTSSSRWKIISLSVEPFHDNKECDDVMILTTCQI